MAPTPTSTQTPPAEVLALLRSGLVFNGVPVVSLRLTLADGTTQRLEMNPATVADTGPPKDWSKTKAGAAILETLAREGRPLKGAAIAANCKPPYSFNGSFRSALAGLLLQGLLSKDEEDDGYTLTE